MPAPQGFTLVELLVATAITAVLAASLYASLHIAFNARTTALAAVEGVRKCSQSIDLIKADLQSAMVPKTVPNGTLVMAGAFTGTSGQGMRGTGGDDLVFFCAAMDVEPDVGIGDVKMVEYCLDVADDTKETVLVRRVTTNILAPLAPQPRQEIIARGVRSFSVRYFDGTSWQNSWDTTTLGSFLPVAVEVTIELQGAPGETPQTISQVILIPCGQPNNGGGI